MFPEKTTKKNMLGPKRKLTVFQRQFFRVYLFGFVVYPWLLLSASKSTYIYYIRVDCGNLHHLLQRDHLSIWVCNFFGGNSSSTTMDFFQPPCAVVKSFCSTPVFCFFFSGGELCLMKPNLHSGLLDRDCDAWCNIWARGALDIAEILQIHQVMQGVSCHCSGQFVENNTKLKSLIMEDSYAGGSFSEYRFPPF